MKRKRNATKMRAAAAAFADVRDARTCQACGTPERTNAIGYSNLTPFSGYCCDCITRAWQALAREGR